MKRVRLLLVLSTLVVVGAAAAAFGQSAHSSVARAVVTTRHTSLGTILVDSAGQTLYLNTGDKPGHFACTGMCAAAWPVLATSGKPKAKGKAKAADLGTIKHGKLTQVTYKGHPLYTFTADTTSSPTSGQGINSFYVVSPSGNKITKTTTTTTPTSSTTTSSTSTTPTTTSSTTTTTTTTTPTTTSSTTTSSTTTTSTSTTSSYSY
jgi:predicted lipoprotein with Yx(FWY)xxD motif